MLFNIWVKDKHTGDIHQVGSDVHDDLRLLNGRIEYYNLQNGDGTLNSGDGGYEFIEAPDPDNHES